MIIKHFPGHQQALIKNNICIAVLSFEEHDSDFFVETIKKFDCDLFVDLCLLQTNASIGAIWKTPYFYEKPYLSWIINENLEWEAPVTKPGDNFNWDESKQEWQKILTGEPETLDPEV
jgi:hypothetical protein